MTSYRSLLLASTLLGIAPVVCAQTTAVPPAADSQPPKAKGNQQAVAGKTTAARKKNATKQARTPVVAVDSEARLDSIYNLRWPVQGPEPLPGSILPGKRIVA